MWTKEVPKKEGYYWVQSVGALSGKNYTHPVHVYCSKKDGKVDTVFSDGENFSIDSDMYVQWYSEEIAMPAIVERKLMENKMFLTDRADGVKGHFCITRYILDDNRYVEYYNKGKWCAFGEVFTETDLICALLDKRNLDKGV